MSVARQEGETERDVCCSTLPASAAMQITAAQHPRESPQNPRIMHQPGTRQQNRCKGEHNHAQRTRIIEYHTALAHNCNHNRNRTPQLQSSRLLTGSPGLFSAQSTPAFADSTYEWAQKRNGPKPTPRAHARIAKPLTQPAPADRRHEQMEAHLGSST